MTYKMGLAVLACTAISTAAQAGEVVIHNWAEYYAEDTIANFESETGLDVVESYFDSNEVQETKMLAGGSGFDVVYPSISGAERQLQVGALMPIDASRLSNYGNLSADVLRVLDGIPGGRKLGVPYTWGTVGIAYNVDMIKERLGDLPVDSWDILMKPETAAKLADCGIGALDSPTDIIPIALNYAGFDPYTTDKSELEQALPILQTMAKSIKYFSSVKIAADLASGNICAAITYNGEASYAQDIAANANSGIELAYVIPKEGTIMWIDMMSIPVDAPNVEAAYQFIDYLLRPEVIAAVTNTVYYANANAAANAFVNADILADRGIYPDGDTMNRLFSDQNVDPTTQRAWTRMWAKVKTGI